MELYIKLRDHFENDTVTLFVNGKEVYKNTELTTDLSISFADSVEIHLAEPIAKLVVQMGSGQSQEKNITVQDTPYVDIWYLEGDLSILTSRQEMPML